MAEPEKAGNCAHLTLEQGESQIKDALSEAEKRIRQGQEKVNQWASDVDKQVHENPWPIVAGVGIGALLLGLVIGRSRN
jgi:ElaB/YqjD/DUF883 family membrane-anchored ribosome-binding protein